MEAAAERKVGPVPPVLGGWAALVPFRAGLTSRLPTEAAGGGGGDVRSVRGGR